MRDLDFEAHNLDFEGFGGGRQEEGGVGGGGSGRDPLSKGVACMTPLARAHNLDFEGFGSGREEEGGIVRGDQVRSIWFMIYGMSYTVEGLWYNFYCVSILWLMVCA